MTGRPASDQSRVTGPEARRPADRAALVGGIVLILVGLGFLLGRLIGDRFGVPLWPLWIVVPGLAMLVGSLFIRDASGVGLAIPGAVVTTVGLVLWVQAVTDAWATWAYAWALVGPGGVGLGMLVHGLATGDRTRAGEGFRTLLVGLGLFLGFALFFEGVLGLSGTRIAGLDTILPAAIVVLGVILLVASLVPRRRGRS